MAKGERRRTVRESIDRATDRNVERAEDLGRLAQAWTAASSEVFTGYARVMGNLAGNLVDDITDRGDEDDERDVMAAGVRRARNVNRSMVESVRESADTMARALDRFGEVYDNEDEPEGETPDEATPA